MRLTDKGRYGCGSQGITLKKTQHRGNLLEHNFDFWETYGTLSCAGIHMFTYIIIENQYFCHIWVTYGIKTDTASELTHWFSTVEGFFLLPKNLLFLVTRKLSMYG